MAPKPLPPPRDHPQRQRKLTEKITDPANIGDIESYHQHALAEQRRQAQQAAVEALSEPVPSPDVPSISRSPSLVSTFGAHSQAASSGVEEPPSTRSVSLLDGDDEDDEPVFLRSRKRRAVESDDEIEIESEDGVDTLKEKESQKPGKKPHASIRDADAVDEHGFLKDIKVPPIDESKHPDGGPSRDIDAFFGQKYKKIAPSGGLKDHRNCNTCRTTIQAEVTTMRRHLESRHAVAYRKWAMENNFVSKLPGDAKKRKAALAAEQDKQQLLDEHLQKLPPKEKKIVYTHHVFREAAIEWLIATNQPLGALEHPTFKMMIDTAAAAQDGIEIPSRKIARATIIRMYSEQMAALKKKFNSDAVKE